MTVRIRVRPIGTHFALIGQCVARNNRIVGETILTPHGCESVAVSRAEALAESHGWTVCS